jgi:predicted amidophosphoribosyltransferase
MVRAVKGSLAAGRYAMVTALDGTTHRVAAGSEQLAFNIFGQWGARVIGQWTNTLLVPIPSSSHTVFNLPFTSSRLAVAIAGRMPATSNVVAAPILAFKGKMPRASAGEAGARDKNAIQNGLQCSLPSLQDQSVVLVDDVCTSGAHLMACASFLRGLGASVNTALCLARTVNVQHPSPLHLVPEDVEAQLSLFGHWPDQP